jgi:hypothetical protein
MIANHEARLIKLSLLALCLAVLATVVPPL